MPPTSPQRYTREELRRAAKAKGFDVKSRLITDWVSLGLLDKGIDRGRGKARGKSYTWSQQQHDLFLTLLFHQRREPSVSRATLANIPVWAWLIFGDAFVPLRQVRRVLATWVGRHGRASWSQAQLTARQVVGQLDHPAAAPNDRDRLFDLLTEAAYQGTVDEERLAELARRVSDPCNTGITRGPLGITTVDDYVKTLVARTTAIAQLDTVPDTVYEAARAVYRQMAAATPEHQIPVGDTQVPARVLGLHKLRLLDDAVQDASLDLVTLLGFELTVPQP